jgi:hypothetical protein
MRPMVFLATALVATSTVSCASSETSGGGPAPSATAAVSTAPPGSMARVPAGVTVPLVRAGRLTGCARPTGLPYIGREQQMDDKVEGFDVELLSLVAERLGVGLEFVETDSNRFLTGEALDGRECDLLAGGFSSDPEAAAYFEMTGPYLRRSLSVLTTADAPYRSLEDLRGKRVTVLPDTPASDFLQAWNVLNDRHRPGRRRAARQRPGPPRGRPGRQAGGGRRRRPDPGRRVRRAQGQHGAARADRCRPRRRRRQRPVRRGLHELVRRGAELGAGPLAGTGRAQMENEKRATRGAQSA